MTLRFFSERQAQVSLRGVPARPQAGRYDEATPSNPQGRGFRATTGRTRAGTTRNRL